MPRLLLIVGALLLISGVIYVLYDELVVADKVEVLEETTEDQEGIMVVEIAGEVTNPGVYKLSLGSRVEDLLVAAGGITANADRNWMAKVLNRAAKLTDGQKIFIPSTQQSTVLSAKKTEGDQSISTSSDASFGSLLNINTASLSQLEALWGIGQITAQNIIDQRPYSTVEELLTKGVLKKNVYDRNKDLLSVY